MKKSELRKLVKEVINEAPQKMSTKEEFAAASQSLATLQAEFLKHAEMMDLKLALKKAQFTDTSARGTGVTTNVFKSTVYGMFKSWLTSSDSTNQIMKAFDKARKKHR